MLRSGRLYGENDTKSGMVFVYWKRTNANTMCAMKKLKILFGTVILSAGLASCSSAYYASAGYASDDLYAVHDRAEISRRKQAEAEAQRAAAEARRAEWEAKIAEAEAAALRRCGVEVQLAKFGTSMAQRCAESNAFGADIHNCVHTNAFNGKVTGTRLFCFAVPGAPFRFASVKPDARSAVMASVSSSFKQMSST